MRGDWVFPWSTLFFAIEWVTGKLSSTVVSFKLILSLSSMAVWLLFLLVMGIASLSFLFPALYVGLVWFWSPVGSVVRSSANVEACEFEICFSVDD